MRYRELLAKIDRTLDRMDGHMARGTSTWRAGTSSWPAATTHMARSNEHMARNSELMAEIREEHRLSREQYRRLNEQNMREYLLSRAAVENNTALLRQLMLQREEDRKILERVEHGIAAQTDGLLRVLDEMRGGGPRAADA